MELLWDDKADKLATSLFQFSSDCAANAFTPAITFFDKVCASAGLEGPQKQVARLLIVAVGAFLFVTVVAAMLSGDEEEKQAAAEPEPAPAPKAAVKTPKPAKAPTAAKTPKSTKSAKASTPSAAANDADVSIGDRVECYWKQEDAWFPATVEKFDKKKQLYQFVYDDGDKEWDTVGENVRPLADDSAAAGKGSKRKAPSAPASTKKPKTPTAGSGKKPMKPMASPKRSPAKAELDDESPPPKKSTGGKPASKVKKATSKGSVDVVEDDYEVDFIVDERIKRGKKEYLVMWKGFGVNDSTWEPEDSLTGSKTALDEYVRMNSSRLGSSRRSTRK